MAIRTSKKSGKQYCACARTGGDPKCKGFVRMKNGESKTKEENGTEAPASASGADAGRAGDRAGAGDVPGGDTGGSFVDSITGFLDDIIPDDIFD
jgi:hypothetical protein